MSHSERPSFGLLGAAASLITILGFLGIKGLAGEPEQTSQPVTPATTAPGPAPTYEPTRRATTRVTERTEEPATAPATEVTCTVVDELGERQTAESVLLKINGQSYRMSIDTDGPRQQLRLRYTRPAAALDYTIMVSTRFDDGSLVRGGGRGEISCTGGETYAVAGDYSTNPSRIVLERS